MQNEIAALLDDAKASIKKAQSATDIEQLRTHYLGKKGQLTALLKEMTDLSADQRPQVGKIINLAKQELQSLLSEQEALLKHSALKNRLESETIDITLPGRSQNTGSLHPVTQVRNRAVELFRSIGFSVVEGPEIEDDYHNFQALNMLESHPARDSHDTFYFKDGSLLRTHTSPSQIRVMQNQSPPLRIITPGRVFRRDSDQTHTPMFHQIEGLVVDTYCHFGHLKALLQNFLQNFFEADLEFRFRPSFFPFTEPSAEIDIRQSGGKWLEILGCGMVHPQVLKNVGIDSETYSGFAFGLGLDRMAMLHYDIPDLRMLFENDLRFLAQF